MFKKLALVFVTLLLSLIGFLPLATSTAAGTNLVKNPSVETANAAGTAPTNWKKDKWGTNDAVFSYKTNEGQSGTKSLYVNMTKRTSGDAKWYFTQLAVKPNQKYTYSEFYKSSVTTEVDIEYADTSGKLSYVWLGSPAVSNTAWQTKTFNFTTPANVKTLTIFHVLNKVGWLQTDNFSLTEVGTTPSPTPPTVTLTAPAANATVAGNQTLSASATDAIGVAGVQFKVDNVNVGTEDTTAPYSATWDTALSTNGTHTVTAVARNTSNLTATTSRAVTVKNPTAPTVSITTPFNGAVVNGTQAVNANATDTGGIKNVQFKLDGVPLGNADISAPYSISWDTALSTNGTHTLSAVATNMANITTTAATVTVTVQNTITPPPQPANLLPNPSFETANGVVPQSWFSSNWGTNTAVFSYLDSGHTGSYSVKAEITSYTNGAANWYYSGIPVNPNTSYKYENWYQSNVDTEIDAEVIMNDGSVQYFYLTTVPANVTWSKVTATFTPPTGAKSLAIYQILAKKGYIVTDDYSLAEYVPTALNRAIVSLTFDDGRRSIYSNGLPLLKKYGLVSTQYLLTGTTDYPDYMTVAMMAAFRDQGSEIASQTVNHLDLTQQNATTLRYELSQSQNDLQNWLGVTVNNFATPYGAYNTTALDAIKQYYRSHRSTDEGFNTKDSFDIYNIKVQNILNTTTPEQVKVWVDQAIREKTWLVLVYHEVDSGAVDTTYAVTPANLDAELAYLKQTGVAVKTVNQALDEIIPQL